MSGSSKKVIPASKTLEDSAKDIARFRPCYYIGYEAPRVISSQFDSRSAEEHCFEGFKFIPSELILHPNDRRILVQIEVGIPENPHKENLIKPTKKDKYFSFPKAEILENYVISVTIDNPCNTNYSGPDLDINRLVMLVPLGFCGTFIHYPQPSLFPEFRRLIVGLWNPETANRSDTLSPEVSIVSNGTIIAPNEKIFVVE